MRKFQKTSILCSIPITLFLCTQIASSHNIGYSENISRFTEIQEKNTNYNIQKAKLLKRYINTLKWETTGYKTDHEISNELIDSRVFQLKVMYESLSKIQTIYIEKHHAESITFDIIEKLKTIKQELNETLKWELQKSRSELLVLHAAYSIKTKLISKRFIYFVNVFTPKVRKISNNEKKKLILSALTRINVEASKLVLFPGKNFISKKQMRASYSNSLMAIERELNTIRAVIKQK